MAPSCTWSSTPVTVTVCGAFQLAAVNVRVDALTMPSVASLEATGITTSAVGWLFRTTENRSEERRVGKERRAGGATERPATSGAGFLRAKWAASRPQAL